MPATITISMADLRSAFETWQREAAAATPDDPSEVEPPKTIEEVAAADAKYLWALLGDAP